MSKTFIIIPTYNEAENLPLITADLFRLNIPELEIMVVDDGSPDGTGKLADQLTTQYTGKFHVMHRTGKLGLGTAYIQGITWALERGADYIIQMDADFSHSPSYIPQFLQLIPGRDLVVGSRYIAGGRLDERWGWGRRFLSWWANSVWIRILLGMRTKDATSGFRCWQATALKRIGLQNIRSSGYVFLVEMCYLAEKCGLKIEEIPIYFKERDLGESKMSLPIQLEAALRVLEIRRRYRNSTS